MTQKPYLHPLCEILRNERLRRGLTQALVAEKAGIWQSSISEYESGRRVPSLESLDAWAAALGLVATIDVKENP